MCATKKDMMSDSQSSSRSSDWPAVMCWQESGQSELLVCVILSYLLCYASLSTLVSKSKKRKSAGLTLGLDLAESAVRWETDNVRGIQYECVVASWHTTSTVNLCWPSSRLRMHKDHSAPAAEKACQRPELPLAVCVFREVAGLQPQTGDKELQLDTGVRCNVCWISLWHNLAAKHQV